jgi:GTP cyclohydrolase I
MCEHHLLPFIGKVWLAYIPDGAVVGLSKLARLVEHYARRPQVQERLTGQLTAALDKHVTGCGSAALVRATHSCASLRGVRKEFAMTTSSLTGGFRAAGTREEFLAYTRAPHE